MTPEDQTTALGVLRWKVNRLLALVLILLVITAWSLVRLNQLEAAETCQAHGHGIPAVGFGSTSQTFCP